MIYVLLGVSLLFVIIGFIVTEGNAQYLLAGYNTMREEDRKKLDISALISFFRRFHLFLGISLLLLGTATSYLISEEAGGIFLALYPILAYLYFIVIARKYSRGVRKVGNSISIIILAVTLLAVAGLLGYGLQENALIIEPSAVIIKGNYGETLTAADIAGIALVDQPPKISYKTNGFALGSARKGYFRTSDQEVVKLILNANQEPVILFTKTDGKKIYYSAKRASNEEIIDEIQQALPDKVQTP